MMIKLEHPESANICRGRCYPNEKSTQRRCKHCALAVVTWSQKNLHRCRPPSRGHRTAKI